MASLVASVEAKALLPLTDTDTRDGLEVVAAAAASADSGVGGITGA